MSSMYRLICLSHNPGIVLDTEWHSSANGRAMAEALLLNPTFEGHGEVMRHAACDLVAGAYSYPLVEVGYIIGQGKMRSVEWIDSQWVRLLAAAAGSRTHTPEDDYRMLPRGWTWDTAARLRGELGLGDTEETT